MIFADDTALVQSDWRLVLCSMIFAAVGSAIQVVIHEWRENKKEKSAKSEAEEKTLADYQNELVSRLDKEKADIARERDRVLAENRELVHSQHEEELITAKMRTHIRYLEFLLTQSAIQFDRYEPSGSGVHSALPDTPPQPKN